MYPRLLNPPKSSFFLFGPRSTGKTTWVESQFKDALSFDLLEAATYTRLLAEPGRLSASIPENHKNWIVIDEVQRVPDLLNEVHRLIQKKKYRFVLTGSSARKLRRGGVNLLAGRALTHSFFPLTARELGGDFNLAHALQYGMLPPVWSMDKPKAFLQSYIKTYLREEIQEEGLTRNLPAFSRFLEAATFSQGSILNISNVARDAAVDRKVVEDYFSILDDLMLGVRLPVFSRRAKRALMQRSKFYFFDVGVYRILRPRGPLDVESETDGPALETLVLQELRALNHYLDLEYELFFWHTKSDHEVDFVLYGPRGLIGMEVKRSSIFRESELDGLKLFYKDYPIAKLYFLYGGTKRFHHSGAVYSVLKITTRHCESRSPHVRSRRKFTSAL